MPVCARIESVVIIVMFCVLHTIQREKNNNKGVDRKESCSCH